MGEVFNDTIYLFSCGVRGIMPVLNHDLNVMKIYNTAMSHGIWQVTFLAVKKLYNIGVINVKKEIFDIWNKEVLRNTVQAIQRNVAVCNIIAMLEKNDVRCCVLKGEVLADLYHDPACRLSLSSDTDILIDKKSLKTAIGILNKYDFVVENYVDSHHVNCYHPHTGLIELHLRPYGETSEIWFGKRNFTKVNYRQIKTKLGNCINTLDINDGFVFTILHFIKHYLNDGVGIRQLMDVLLYMVYHKNNIDWNAYNHCIKNLRYDKFMDNVIGIGIEFLGFNQNELPKCKYSYNITRMILSDLEKRAGQDELRQSGFVAIYTRERLKRSSDCGKYINIRMKSIFRSLFLNKADMEKKHSYVANNSLLLPVAWLHRILNFLMADPEKKKEFKHYINPGLGSEIAKRRMELMRELDMI